MRSRILEGSGKVFSAILGIPSRLQPCTPESDGDRPRPAEARPSRLDSVGALSAVPCLYPAGEELPGLPGCLPVTSPWCGSRGGSPEPNKETCPYRVRRSTFKGKLGKARQLRLRGAPDLDRTIDPCAWATRSELPPQKVSWAGIWRSRDLEIKQIGT